MISDPWLLMLPNVVLEKLVPCCVLTPGMVRLKSLNESRWECCGCRASVLESLWGSPEGGPGHCILPPSSPALLCPLLPQTVSILRTFGVSIRVLFSKQNSSHILNGPQTRCPWLPLGRPGAVTLVRTPQPHSTGSFFRTADGQSELPPQGRTPTRKLG